MNSGLQPAEQNAAALDLDAPTRSAMVDIDDAAIGRRLRDKRAAPSQLLRFLYWIYERRLLHQLERGSLPRHVGIILDGNRRHARRRGLDPAKSINMRPTSSTTSWAGVRSSASLQLHFGYFQRRTLSDQRLRSPESSLQSKPSLRRWLTTPFMHQKRIRVRAIGRLDIYRNRLLLRSAQRKWRLHSTIQRP